MPNQLAIFDLDGTLCDRDSTDLYPAMAALLRSLATQGVKIAIATNQGGPACHDAGWEFSANFPSSEVVIERLDKIQAVIESLTRQPLRMEVCWAYKSKAGQILLPNHIRFRDLEKWDAQRKPNPGMLLDSMRYHNATPATTTMYGDSADDEAAAKAAGCKFILVKKGEITE